MHYKSDKLAVVLIITFSLLGVSRLLAEDGLGTLKEVESHLEAHSFSATCEWSDGQASKVMQKTASNGVFEVKNEIVYARGGLRTTNVFITNQQGVWHILHDKAVKIDPIIRFNTNSVFYGLLANRVDLSVPATYGVETGKYNQRDVFIVVQKPQITADATKKASMVAVENKFYVGKEDFFLYGFSQKTLDGSVVTMTVTDSNVWQEIPDVFFELPDGMPTENLTNLMEYATELEKEVDRTIQNPEVKAAYQKNNQRRVYVVWAVLALPTLLLAGWAVKSVLNKKKTP